MTGMYHYHYIAIVWNLEDFSDLHILKTKSKTLGIFVKEGDTILFGTLQEAKDYTIKQGFKNCEIVALFHSRM